LLNGGLELKGCPFNACPAGDSPLRRDAPSSGVHAPWMAAGSWPWSPGSSTACCRPWPRPSSRASSASLVLRPGSGLVLVWSLQAPALGGHRLWLPAEARVARCWPWLLAQRGPSCRWGGMDTADGLAAGERSLGGDGRHRVGASGVLAFSCCYCCGPPPAEPGGGRPPAAWLAQVLIGQRSWGRMARLAGDWGSPICARTATAAFSSPPLARHRAEVASLRYCCWPQPGAPRGQGRWAGLVSGRRGWGCCGAGWCRSGWAGDWGGPQRRGQLWGLR